MNNVGLDSTGGCRQVRSCGICDGQSGAGTGLFRVFRFPLPILVPLTASHTSSSIRGWYNRPISGRRTKWTVSSYFKKLKKREGERENHVPVKYENIKEAFCKMCTSYDLWVNMPICSVLSAKQATATPNTENAASPPYVCVPEGGASNGFFIKRIACSYPREDCNALIYSHSEE
jgi:hypothetical protein